MRIIKYYEHSVNPGEVVPLRLHALEEIVADVVCNLLNNEYRVYGNHVVKIEFRRADIQYIYCNNIREANFELALHRKDSIIDDIFVTINYNTNELISIESNIGSAFNLELFKELSERLMKNEKEKKGMKIKISLDEFESICKRACCEYFNDKPKADQYCYATNNRGIDTDRMVLKVELSFIPNNVFKCRHIVIFTVNGISGNIDYAACPSLPSGTGDALCGIICRMIRNQCMGYTDTDDANVLKNDPVVQYCLSDVVMQSKKTLTISRNDYKAMLNSLYGTDINRKNEFEIEKIIINEPAMIAFWKDGTKTVVTATDEAFDEEKGLAMAFAKKALGNNYAAGGRFKAKLKHAERVKRKEETVETDISKIPICKEIMDEAMRRIKTEMESASAADDGQKEKPTSGRYPWGEDKQLKKSEFVKQMLDAGFTKDEADAMWKGYKER